MEGQGWGYYWGPAKEISQSDTNCLFKGLRQTFIYVQHKNILERVHKVIEKVTGSDASNGILEKFRE